MSLWFHKLRELTQPLWVPISMPIKYSNTTFLWFVFTLLATFIGTISNCIIRYALYGLTLSQSLYVDSISGSFYIMAIVMIASLLGPMFITLIKREQIQHRKIKITLVSITIFILFFAGICYTVFTRQDALCIEAKNVTTSLDLIQFSFIVLAIILAYYCFGLQILDEHSNDYPSLQDTYEANENRNVKSIINSSISQHNDGNGVEI